jgi:thymidine kinase
MSCGKLELIIGPMFSGKSTELIREIRLAKIIDKKVLVIKPLIDNRYSENEITSHSFDSEKCETISMLEKINDKVGNYDLIVIDEGQFFPDLKKMVLHWVDDRNLHVIVGGLDGDFKRQPIGQILELIPYADKCKKISSLCKYCNNGTKALFSYRKAKNEQQVQIGGAETYVPLCRQHYLFCENQDKTHNIWNNVKNLEASLNV